MASVLFLHDKYLARRYVLGWELKFLEWIGDLNYKSEFGTCLFVCLRASLSLFSYESTCRSTLG